MHLCAATPMHFLSAVDNLAEFGTTEAGLLAKKRF